MQKMEVESLAINTNLSSGGVNLRDLYANPCGGVFNIFQAPVQTRKEIAIQRTGWGRKVRFQSVFTSTTDVMDACDKVKARKSIELGHYVSLRSEYNKQCEQNVHNKRSVCA